MKKWVQTTIDKIENRPYEFSYLEEDDTSCYVIRFFDLRVKVYRTGFVLAFNGVGRWESVDRNYYQVLRDHNETMLDSKLVAYDLKE